MTDSATQQLEQWLATERTRPEPDPERAQQVWSRVQSRLEGTTAAPPWAPASGRPLWPWLVAGVVALLTTGAVATGAIGTASNAFDHGSAIALQAPTAPRPAVTLAQLTPASPAVESSEPPAARQTKTPAAAAKAPGFAEELALIERGRKALAAGQPGKVLAAMREHRKTFPRGVLREEAAALRTAATCAAQDGQAAAETVARFEQRWSKSVHADLVRRHCR